MLTISKCNPHPGRHNRHSKTFQILHSTSIPQDQPQQNPHTIQPIPVQSQIPTQSRRNYSTNVPEYIELGRRPGTSVERLHQDCNQQHVVAGQIEIGVQVFFSKQAGNRFGQTLKHAKNFHPPLPIHSTNKPNQDGASPISCINCARIALGSAIPPWPTCAPRQQRKHTILSILWIQSPYLIHPKKHD